MWVDKQFNKDKPSIIVTSCYSKNCHPETCCCGEGEFALMQEVPTRNSLNMIYGCHYASVAYGTREELNTLRGK